MARPTTTTSRPQALAASATARRRATFEAKVVTATRCGASAMSRARVLATSASLGLRPSRTTFVESHTSARMPSSPSARNVASEVEAPITGVSSSFQSPVCRTRPWAVRIASACDSGIECATGTYSTLNGPSSRRRPGAISRRSTLGAPGSPRRRVSIRLLAKRVA